MRDIRDFYYVADLYLEGSALLGQVGVLRFEAESDHFGERVSAVPELRARKADLEPQAEDLRERCEAVLREMRQAMDDGEGVIGSGKGLEELAQIIRHAESALTAVRSASDMLWGMR